MSYNLFLDDVRDPKNLRYYPGDGSLYDTEDWVIVRSVSEFKTALRERGVPKSVSFDYVLNDEDGDGLLCAQYLYSYCMARDLELPIWLVHSSMPGIYDEFIKVFER